jgi:hypothetical protein
MAYPAAPLPRRLCAAAAGPAEAAALLQPILPGGSGALAPQQQARTGGGYPIRVANSYARNKRVRCAFSKIRCLLRPQGLRPLWYLKSIHLVRGFE